MRMANRRQNGATSQGAAVWSGRAALLCLVALGAAAGLVACEESDDAPPSDVSGADEGGTPDEGGAPDEGGTPDAGPDGDADDVGEPPVPPVWVQEITGLPQDFVFKGVYVADDGRVVAAGNDGVIAERDLDGAWRVADQGEGDLLNAVHGSSSSDVWAVGKDGVILHGDELGFGASTSCASDGDCEDGDACTIDTCDAQGLCVATPTGGPGCCGSQVGGWSFDTGDLMGWTVSGVKGGVSWAPASLTVFGVPRWLSPLYALHYGNSTMTPPNFDGGAGVIVGADATSPQVALPKSGSASLTFGVYMDTESSTAWDQLNVFVVVDGDEVQIWDKSLLPTVPTLNWLEQTVDLTPWIGETVQLRFRFDSVDGGGNFGEGVYLDDIRIDTSCAGPGAKTFPTLWGTHALAEDQAYAVGLEGTILRFNGQSWFQVAGPGSTQTFLDMYGVGGEMVLVGEGGTIVKAAGGGQLPVTSPTGVALRGVHSATGEVWWAVGDAGVVLRGVGETWTVENIGTTQSLHGVFALADDDVYVVGEGGTARHFDGLTWTTVPLPSSVVATNLYGVWGLGNGVVTMTGAEGIVLQGNLAGGFTNIGTLAKGGKLVDVWGSDLDGTLCLVGDTGDAGIGKAVTFTSTWADQVLPVSFHLKATWGTTADDIWVVGLAGLVMRWNGIAWNQYPVPVSTDLNTIWGTGPNDVWAAGADGVLLRFDGQVWTTAASQTTENLRAVHGLDPSNVFAVGQNAAILHFTGLTWAASPVNPIVYGDGSEEAITSHLNAVSGAALDQMWAVGRDGQVLGFDGEAWTTADLSYGITLRGVHAVSASEVWAVGNEGHVLVFNGEEWIPYPSGSIATLYAVHGNASGTVYAVGDLGTVLRLERNPDLQ